MEHKTYPNPDRVGRCEFAVKTILGLAVLAPCLVMAPREGTSLWYKAAALVIVSFALYMSILWMFLIARRLHDFGRTGWWILGFIVFQNVARNLAMAAPKGLALDICCWLEMAVELGILVLVACWPGNRERNEYGFPPEYPKTLLGRFGLADMKRRRVVAIAIVFLLSLGASVACRLTMAPADEKASTEVAWNVQPMPREEIEGALDELKVMGCDYGKFREKFAGQRVTITNAAVNAFYNLGNGWSELSVCRQGQKDGINVLAYIPTERLLALSRDPECGDCIRRISGRVITKAVFMATVGKTLSNQSLANCPNAGNAVWLGDVQELDVPWKDEPLPTIDAETVSGDEFARFITAYGKDMPESMCARLLRPALGRTLDFSTGEIADIHLGWHPHLTISVLDPDTGKRTFSFSVPIEGRHLDAKARNLPMGTKVTNVRATVCEKGDYERAKGKCSAMIWMKDLSFVNAGDFGRLPDFDVATITGDALIGLLKAKLNRALTLEEVKDLARRLDGRCLEFSGVKIESYGMSAVDNEPLRIDDVTVSFSNARLGFELSAKPEGRIAESALNGCTKLTGTVVLPEKWKGGCDDGRFVIHLDKVRFHK